MPVYNGERYLRQAVASVLAQTFEEFELIVIDDASSDRTPEILASFADPRIRVLRNAENLGIVGSLNRGMSAASGRYIARMDADDLCLPTRFARQIAFLEQHPDVVLVGTNFFSLSNGKTQPHHGSLDPDCQLLRCLFLFGNPVAHPTMMFRAEIVPALGQYLNPALQYAEDFDFCHRVLEIGRIAVMPERLLIYRKHAANLTQTRRTEMMDRTAAVLARAYRPLLGEATDEAAALVAGHLFTGTPVTDGGTLKQLGDILDRLCRALAAANRLNHNQSERLTAHVGSAWWRTIQTTLRCGATRAAIAHRNDFPGAGRSRPPLHRLARSFLSGTIPAKETLLTHRRRLVEALQARRRPRRRLVDVGGVSYLEEVVNREDPPSLYVVVDTEAEFDWSGDFARSLTAVNSIAQQEKAQAIFDAYGLRPIYVVDYAVASQPAGYAPLGKLLRQHRCVIGAHLHTWVNPPFEEEISERNSFSGNLPPKLEERKLTSLKTLIAQNFGITPLFYKAGRYGVGTETMATLARLGFAVDFSILPGTDLRGRGGPDFRFADVAPYRATVGGVLSVPTTRGQVGLLPTLPARLRAALQSPLMRRLHVPGLLSRSGLANMVTLTPEGVTAAEQVKLLRQLISRGHRTFVLHYHSPSLGLGNTPYVRTEQDLQEFLRRIETVCRLFFDELGGLPGNPADLLPPHLRPHIWPKRSVVEPRPVPQAAEP
jgi:GT2 family glycosyltransferase